MITVKNIVIVKVQKVALHFWTLCGEVLCHKPHKLAVLFYVVQVVHTIFQTAHDFFGYIGTIQNSHFTLPSSILQLGVEKVRLMFNLLNT